MGMAKALSTPLTKIRPPGARRDLLDRPRLTAALNDSMASDDRTIVMISAPAGFGKTALLSEWISQQPRSSLIAWATFDEDDRDPLVFWWTILDALRLGLEESSTRVFDLEPSLSPREHSVFLAALIEILGSLRDPLVFAFDDAHRLEGSAGDAEFIRFLRLAPRSVHIVFATRASFAHEHARMNGRLFQVTGDALSFTPTEINSLLKSSQIDESYVTELHASSGGWPAALTLGTLLVSRSDAVDPDVQLLVQPDSLRAYLEREVYHDLSPGEQDVLLTTALCPLTTPELIEAITRGTESERIVKRLLAKNAMLSFVSADADGRFWYRVHPVFGEFLRNKFAEGPPTERHEWVERAVAWQLDHGDPLIALDLAVASGENDLITEVLVERGCRIISEGHARLVITAIDSVVVRSPERPVIDLYLAFAAAESGESDRVRTILERIDVASLTADQLFRADWMRYLIELSIARNAGLSTAGLSPGWDESTLADLPDDLRECVLLARSFIEVRDGQISEATKGLHEARAIAENNGDEIALLSSDVGMAVAALGEARISVAVTLAEHAIERGRSLTTQDTSSWISMAHTIAGYGRLQLLELDEARSHASTAVELAALQELDHVRHEAGEVYNLAHFDDLPDKRRLAQEFAQKWPLPFLHLMPLEFILTALHSGLFMAAAVNEFRWSERLLDKARRTIGEDCDWQVAYALHLYRSGRLQSSRTVLTPLLQQEGDSPTPSSQVILWSLEAVLESRADNAFRAHAAMFRALEEADATGCLRNLTLADRGETGRVILRGLGRFGSHEDTARLVVSKNVVSKETMLSGPLTPKESELLIELRSLRTVDEIAHDMLLSVNTVKTHMRGIYRKLSVSSRRDAVAAAEKLGLL